VRERCAIDLPSAIRTMTSLPATVFGLKDRGQIRAGAIADLLIFDLAQVNDAATYQDPHRLAEGFTDILVSGKWARRDNAFTPTLAGRVVAPERR
jgi:N-acyl-D-amino-acid deacylase